MRRFAGLVLFHGLLTLGISFASAAEKTTPPTAGTNVPVSEGFASKSPYVLYREDNRYVLRRHGERSGVDGGSVQIPARRGEGIPVRLAPRPSWYERTTSSGKPMTRIGTLQGTYLGIYQAKVCEYWTEKPKANCRFCSVGLNLGVDDADEKSVDEVMEAA